MPLRWISQVNRLPPFILALKRCGQKIGRFWLQSQGQDLPYVPKPWLRELTVFLLGNGTEAQSKNLCFGVRFSYPQGFRIFTTLRRNPYT